MMAVSAGKGWVCLDGQAPQEIRAGDVVWVGPNERHWHGAAESSLMAHLATIAGNNAMAG